MDGNVDAAHRRVVTLRPTRAMVWARAGVLGAAAYLTGAVSHAAGGGLFPGLTLQTLILFSCVAIAAGFVSRRVSTATVVLLVVAGQTWVHTWLSTAGGHDAAPGTGSTAQGVPTIEPVSGLAGAATMRDAFDATASSVTATSTPGSLGEASHAGSDWLAHQIDHFVAQSPLMLFTHLGGAVAMGLFLARGEHVWWQCVAAARARLLHACLLAERALAARASLGGIALLKALPVQTQVPVGESQLLLRDVERHRGPPFVLAA